MKEVEIKVELNVEAVRAAATNAMRLQDVAFQIPVVNPKELTIDSIIYGFEVVAINDQVKELKNDDAKCIAIKEIVVDGLSKKPSPGNITVNGTYDLPLESGQVVQLSNCYIANKEHALEIARVVTETELERASTVLLEKQQEVDFLKNQLENELF